MRPLPYAVNDFRHLVYSNSHPSNVVDIFDVFVRAFSGSRLILSMFHCSICAFVLSVLL